ncbi:hypothetical protein SMD22_17860 [Brevibacillus halotolerans]|nr:hypothetical protein SMD22_17860 [Brevibacillus halotolerans]
MQTFEQDGRSPNRLQNALEHLLNTGVNDFVEMKGQHEKEVKSLVPDQQPTTTTTTTTPPHETAGLQTITKQDLPSSEDSKAFNLCAPISDSVDPQYKVTHERGVYAQELPVLIGDGIDLQQLSIGCIRATNPHGISAFFGLLLLMEQVWDLKNVAVSDLSYTTSLAPSEQLTIQMQNTQRRIMEKNTLDQAEEMTSEESTTVDKEALNVTRSSTKTEKWHVNGNGRISIGNPLSLGGQLGADAGFDRSTQLTAQVTLNQIHEATKKSAHSLKTLHKVEVRGFSEDVFDKRITRVIRNPYPDRTLSLNVFQLVKHYKVTSQLSDQIFALFISINNLEFDDQFIGAYIDFLRNHLLDPVLVDELPLAFKGAQLSVKRALDVAKMALHYLYDEPNIFQLPPIQINSNQWEDPNLPATSYDVSDFIGFSGFSDLSGFKDSLESDNHPRESIPQIFTIMNMYYKIYKDKVSDGTLTEYAIDLALSLDQGVGALWKGIQNNKIITEIMDNGSFTECFRRLSGFLALVEGMLKPVVSIDEEKEMIQKRSAALNALNRVKDHLHCNRNYYIQKLLIHLERSTESNAITEFVDLIIERLNVPDTVKKQLRQLLDIQRAYVDRQQIIVPAYRSILLGQLVEFSFALSGGSGNIILPEPIPPLVQQIEVPCDGVHIEVAQGLCRLREVPTDHRGEK